MSRTSSMTGVVLSYDRRSCYGFIRGDDEREYFCHRSEILGPALEPGERVEFDPVMAPKGLRAVGVRRVAGQAI